jgi:hypothetical protein
MTAVAARAPFPHALDGPSLRSKRGVEHFRCAEDTRSRATRPRGAPTSPRRAAITPDAPNTGLRQCQCKSTNPVAIGSTRVADTLRWGPLTDRHRTFPGGWGVNREKSYRRGRHQPLIATSSSQGSWATDIPMRAPLTPGCTPKTSTAATRQSAGNKPRVPGRGSVVVADAFSQSGSEFGRTPLNSMSVCSRRTLGCLPVAVGTACTLSTT